MKVKVSEQSIKHLVDNDCVDMVVEYIRKLEAENAGLRAEVERLRASSFVTAVPVEQYERLIKAGGWLYTELECFYRNEFCDHPDYEEERPSMKAWNAAKEGKPHA